MPTFAFIGTMYASGRPGETSGRTSKPIQTRLTLEAPSLELAEHMLAHYGIESMTVEPSPRSGWARKGSVE
jgi:hypothetical protein